MDRPLDLTMWLDTGVGFLLALGWVVVGAVVVRPAHPRAGGALLAAGALNLLVTCCVQATRLGPRLGYGGAELGPGLGRVVRGLGLVNGIVLHGAIAFAVFALGKALGSRPAGGAA
jgi:hypothetical protein